MCMHAHVQNVCRDNKPSEISSVTLSSLDKSQGQKGCRRVILNFSHVTSPSFVCSLQDLRMWI